MHTNPIKTALKITLLPMWTAFFLLMYFFSLIVQSLEWVYDDRSALGKEMREDAIYAIKEVYEDTFK